MSKKCCGIIYSDEDKVCRVCGRKMAEDGFLDIETGLYQPDDEKTTVALHDEETESDKNSEEMVELVDNQDEPTAVIEPDDREEMAKSILGDSQATDMVLLGEIFKEDEYTKKLRKKEQKKREKKEKNEREGITTGVRILGVLSILMALFGTVLLVVSFYSLVLNPSYNRNEYLDKPLVFTETDALTDERYAQEYISDILATSTDASEATATDAMATDDEDEAEATPTDADELTTEQEADDNE